MIAVDKVKNPELQASRMVCSCFDMTRDAYYKYIKRYEKSEQEKEKVVELVNERRKELPREGVRKLHVALFEDFVKQNLESR